MGIPAISHPPRILMLYGSVRERSYSRLATEEAGRLLTAMGADVRILIHLAFHFLMMHRNHIQKLWSCVNWFAGLKEWCGALRNDMER